jgi:exopolyphosphatase/guanosine-5'-triphosphate,3'-diphosphate pyrophosphatase
MSRLVLSQKGNLRKVGEYLADPDFAKAIFSLRLAIMFMHSKIAIDPSRLTVRMKNRIELEIPVDWSRQHPTISVWLDKEKAWWAQVGMDFTIRLLA